MQPALTRLALITDAWHPQTNGVVNTLSRLVRYLEGIGFHLLVVTGESCRTVPLPFYREVRVACDPWKMLPRIRSFRPDAVHIATEGPLGLCARVWLARTGVDFTTSYHTRFPEYVTARMPVPLGWMYAAERWFHSGAIRTMVGTHTVIRELQSRHVGRSLVHWPRGVDESHFHPGKRRDDVYPSARPIWLYVGRVAVEKSLEDFLRLDLPGTKVVVGDGPARAQLQRRFPTAVWRGWRHGDDLAAHFASADCFVFPSRTETFGNVILEALASGLPVAAVPAAGALDVIEDGCTGAVGDPLRDACLRALQCSSDAARRAALRYSWRASHELFRNYLVPARAAAA